MSQPCADSGEVLDENNSPGQDGGHLNTKITNLTSKLPYDIEHVGTPFQGKNPLVI